VYALGYEETIKKGKEYTIKKLCQNKQDGKRWFVQLKEVDLSCWASRFIKVEPRTKREQEIEDLKSMGVRYGYI